MKDTVVELQNEIAALRAEVAQLKAEKGQSSSYRNRAFQHLVSDSEHIFVTVIDTEGRYSYVNPAFVAKFCADQEPPIGRYALETVVPEDWSTLEQATVQCFTKPGHPVRATVRKPGTRGTVYTTDWELIGIADRNGVPEGVLCIGLDITAHLKTQQDLETANLRFEQLANNIQDVFWIYDRATERVVYVSPAFAAVWGYTAEQLYARQEIFVEAIHPEDRELAFSSLAEQAQGRQTEREYRIVQPDGTIRHIWDRGFPIKDDQGEITSVAGIASDITELKLAAEHIRRLNETLEQRVQERTEELTYALARLAEQRDFLRQIMESMAEGVLVYDAARNVEYVNPFLIELTGMSAEEIAAALLKLETIVDENDTLEQQLEARSKGFGGSYEVHVRTKSGEKKYVRMSSTPRMVNGQFAGGIVVATDLTQRRKAEEYLRATSEALTRANAELGAAARMKDEFLANVSHELRTPLTGILAISEALLADTYGFLAAEMQRPVKMIEESGRHLLSLINDVLDVAKIEAGSFELERGQVHVDEICMASLRLVREIAVQRRQTISFSMDPAGIVLEADARRLKQILVNLLGNAVKFTPEGGQLGLIVHGDPLQRSVTFSVWDNGIGIPAEKLPQLFQPFMQVQSEFNRAYGGTGLGLALVQRLAALHNGTVTVHSEPDKGTRFDVVLPWTASGIANGRANEEAGGQRPAPNSQADTTPAKPEAVMQTAPAKQITILLAEDNNVTRSVLADFLEIQGYAVLQAGDGAQAVKLAEERKPGLVMMDIQMPGMDGVEAIRMIRSLSDPTVANVPIVALTAHAMQGAREQFMEAGADGYLSKPLRLADLRRCIAEFLPKERI
ncbi:MAG: PAS domain S-box protein [Caldilineaceae bacterium]